MSLCASVLRVDPKEPDGACDECMLLTGWTMNGFGGEMHARASTLRQCGGLL
jgi:hypothetical protein